MMDIVKKHELFKLQWMIDHGYTLEDLMKELDKLKRESPFIDLPMLFDHWQFDVGFGSEIWPCFDEWTECEGRENTIRDATFISVWDGDFCVETSCKVNLKTGEVFDIAVSEGTADLVNCLEAEFVRFDNGSEFEVERGQSEDGFWYDE